MINMQNRYNRNRIELRIDCIFFLFLSLSSSEIIIIIVIIFIHCLRIVFLFNVYSWTKRISGLKFEVWLCGWCKTNESVCMFFIHIRKLIKKTKRINNIKWITCSTTKLSCNFYIFCVCVMCMDFVRSLVRSIVTHSSGNYFIWIVYYFRWLTEFYSKLGRLKSHST